MRAPIVVSWVFAGIVIVDVAHAAAPPPTPEQTVEPARNAAAWDDPPPALSPNVLEQYAKQDPSARLKAGPLPTRGHRVEPKRRRPVMRTTAVRSKRMQARHPGYTECAAVPSMSRLGILISAEGYSYCYINPPADLLANRNCVDLWVYGGYWTTLSCSEWRSCAVCAFIAGHFEGRLCTPGRYFRPESRMFGVHGNSAYGAYNGNYIQC